MNSSFAVKMKELFRNLLSISLFLLCLPTWAGADPLVTPAVQAQIVRSQSQQSALNPKSSNSNVQARNPTALGPAETQAQTLKSGERVSTEKTNSAVSLPQIEQQGLSIPVNSEEVEEFQGVKDIGAMWMVVFIVGLFTTIWFVVKTIYSFFKPI